MFVEADVSNRRTPDVRTVRKCWFGYPPEGWRERTPRNNSMYQPTNPTKNSQIGLRSATPPLVSLALIDQMPRHILIYYLTVEVVDGVFNCDS